MGLDFSHVTNPRIRLFLEDEEAEEVSPRSIARVFDLSVVALKKDLLDVSLSKETRSKRMDAVQKAKKHLDSQNWSGAVSGLREFWSV